MQATNCVTQRMMRWKDTALHPGDTPLSVTVLGGHVQCAAILRKAGAKEAKA